MVQSSTKKKLKELLEAASVCQRCLLRFYGAKEYTSYYKQNVVKSLQSCLTDDESSTETFPEVAINDTEISPPAKKVLLTTCPACLGVLQDIDKRISEVEIAVNKSNYKFKDFVLHIALPVVIDLREKLFLFYLQDELGESFTLTEKEIPSVKDICKWVIGSQYGDMIKADFTPFSDFQICLSFSYPATISECSILLKKCPEAFPNARKKSKEEHEIYTKKAVLNALDILSSSVKSLYTVPPQPPAKPCVFEKIECNHSPLYLGGRYNKYSRDLSQTPWVVDGKRHMESSVSELITDIVEKHIISDKIIFSSSGREDVDVRMLGNGRPFVLEILNPRNSQWTLEEMKLIENEINQHTNLIAVNKLQVITKEDTLQLKEGEEQKRKSYSALCIVEKVLTQSDIDLLQSLNELKLYQKTPIRVLHRRTLSTREKILYSLKGEILSDHHLRLSIESQAGTYIKEFVHSDFGRTTPSLGTLLGTTADILELDVKEIDLVWPPNCTS